MKLNTLKDLQSVSDKGKKALFPKKKKVIVGMATCGLATGSGETYDTLKAEIEARKLDVDLVPTGCSGSCFEEPLVDVLIPGMPRISYHNVTKDKVPKLLDALENDKVLEKMSDGGVYAEDPLIDVPHEYTKQKREDIPDIGKRPFNEKQYRIVLRNCGLINPESIEEYIARGGYSSLYSVLSEMSAEEVITAIDKSGLRGRGGGGFSTGRKWRSARDAHGDVRYVIVNADEGDPGAYMDRSILEGDPHSVIEGLVIGAYAIGSHEGFIYVRNEYPLAVKRITMAVESAREYGLLGKDIFKSGFDFNVSIVKGGGAFVCGESTALMASIEGKAGEPRAKYIHTVEKGLWEKPSCLNNVETWANVPLIINRGAEWFGKIGTDGSKGTKVFSLVGKVKNVGLVEVPMGLSLREIIYDIGGGILGDKKFKAVQTGGPSGGCIPEEFLDTPVDFDELTKLGSMMGSGGMIVMDEGTCMVDVAKYFIDFLVDESCGKCTPCREGLRQLRSILTRITKGEGRQGDIELLEEIGEGMIWGSLCALGGSAPNPVLTTIKYFRDEYEAHINEKRCPAGVCPDLISFSINPDTCIGCMRCLKACPVSAITGENKKVHKIDDKLCIRCRACYEVCPVDAVIIK